MNIPVAKKVAMLKEFHTHLYHDDWCFMESTEKDKAVLEEFPVVCSCVHASGCVCVHAHACMWPWVGVCMWVCMCDASGCACTCMHVGVCVCMWVCVHASGWVCTCMGVCV